VGAQLAEPGEFAGVGAGQAGGGAPLRPWSRVVRTLAAGHAAAARLVAGSPFLAALASSARDPGGGLADPKGARSQLSFDLAEVIAAAAARRPVLVVVDDAHQADPSSLRLLAELAPALRAMPVAVLVTTRDGDQAWQGRLDERGALLRSGLVITLPPFAEGDVADLVASLTRAPPAPDLVGVIAERSGDDAALAACLAALCDAIAGPDHCAERRDCATEIIEIAGRLRDPVLGLLGRRLRLVALLEAGAIADWEADALAYQTAAQALRHPLYAWYVPLWRGMRALAAGRFGECRDALAEAGDTGARAGSRNADMLVATQQWCLHAEEGDVAGLLTMLPQLDAAPMAGAMLQVTRALLLAQVGRAEEARAQFEAVAPLLPALARDSEWLPVVAQVAETLALTGFADPHPVAR
jgi:hypothetical protein